MCLFLCLEGFGFIVLSSADIENDGDQVKTKEILLIGILFFLGFMLSEFFIEHIVFDGPVQRLIARILFQGQFYLIIYLLFNSFDLSRRVKWLELIFSRDRTDRLRLLRLRKKRRIESTGRKNHGK